MADTPLDTDGGLAPAGALVAHRAAHPEIVTSVASATVSLYQTADAEVTA